MMGLDRIEVDPSKELRQGRYQNRASRRATGSCRHASRFMSTRIGPIVPRSSYLIVPHQTINSQQEDLILAGHPTPPAMVDPVQCARSLRHPEPYFYAGRAASQPRGIKGPGNMDC